MSPSLDTVTFEGRPLRVFSYKAALAMPPRLCASVSESLSWGSFPPASIYGAERGLSRAQPCRSGLGVRTRFRLLLATVPDRTLVSQGGCSLGSGWLLHLLLFLEGLSCPVVTKWSQSPAPLRAGGLTLESSVWSPCCFLL